MVAKLKTKLVKNLTSKEYRQCLALNMQGEGAMQSVVCRERHNGGRARTYLLYDDDVLVSWALVFGESHAYFYTRHGHRRRGHATKVLKRVAKDYGKVVVFVHDDASDGFFGKHKRLVDA